MERFSSLDFFTFSDSNNKKEIVDFLVNFDSAKIIVEGITGTERMDHLFIWNKNITIIAVLILCTGIAYA